MKIKLLCLSLIITITGFSQTNFLAPVTNNFGLTPDPESTGRSSSSFGDLDNDGDLDFISGDSNNFYYFENIGSTTNPSYATAVANPFNTTPPSSGSIYTPVFVDLDGDGDLDIVSGNNFGQYFYYENTGTITTPSYANQIQGAFGLVDANFRLLSPSFIDLDSDGDLDMMAGVFQASEGNFFYFENTGSPTAPQYAVPVQDPFNLAWSNATSNPGSSGASFADLDEDGDFDLLAGASSGNYYYYENTGTATTPNFANSQENPFSLTPSGISSDPSFGDLDNDGDLDIISGINSSDFVYYENELPMPTTEIPDPVFEQYLIDRGWDDVIDGSVVTANIENQTLINFSALGVDTVSDITGIGDFTSLTTLDISGNPISGLDISNNVALTFLDIRSTFLSSVDLTNNNNLVTIFGGEFDAMATPVLNTLDVSNNTALIQLILSNTLISDLSLSSNVVLRDLQCNSCALTEINIINNPDIEIVRLNNNSLTEIDLFSNDKLRELDLSFNQVVNIDINQNPDLTILRLNNNSLERPFLANGNNTSISVYDIRDNTNLTCITIDDLSIVDEIFFNTDATASYSLDCNSLWTVVTEDTNFDNGLLAIDDGGTVIDTNGDGEITYQEAQDFTGVMQLNNQGITDVTGLEAFTNADTIDLSDNIIVDINTFLNSESFIIEAVARNQELSQSIVLRRPKIRIKSLNVARNNITEIDISRTEGMETLDVSGNPLTSLTLGEGTAVNTRFNTPSTYRSTSLISLNATDTGGGLGCIQVDDITDANTKVTSGAWLIDSGSSFSTNCAASLSIADFSLANSVIVYPNPADTQITFSTFNNVSLNAIEVYNMLGERLISSSQRTIDIRNFTKGIYLLKITTNKGVLTKKIIKQ